MFWTWYMKSKWLFIKSNAFLYVYKSRKIIAPLIDIISLNGQSACPTWWPYATLHWQLVNSDIVMSDAVLVISDGQYMVSDPDEMLDQQLMLSL